MEKTSGGRRIIQYLKYFIAIIIGSILGIYLHLNAFVTFIPKKIPYWYLFDLLFWVFFGNALVFYIVFYNKEAYIKQKKLRNAESGVIEDEMVVEIKRGFDDDKGKGILSFDGDKLDFKGIKKSSYEGDKFSFDVKLGDILNLSAEIVSRKDLLLAGKEEVRGTIILKTKDGLEYRFSNESMLYHNYEISTWMEYLSNPNLLKKKINLNKVHKCPYCRTLLENDNTYCPNCLKYKCPMCGMWLEKKYSACPDCCYEFNK